MDFLKKRGIRPLLVDGEHVFAWRKNGLYISKNSGLEFRLFKKLPFSLLKNIIRNSSLASRVLREGMHDLRLLPGERCVGIIRGHIIVAGKGDDHFSITHSFRVGSRPLSLCWHGGYLYYGEYFSNNERGYVDILRSPDGVAWETIYRFPDKSIRHIHNIISDPYRKGLWVLTGDSNEESAVWFTDDEFNTLTRVIYGGQYARAVTLIPIEKGLIIPMDSPIQENHINFYEFNSGKLLSICKIESSAFFSVSTGGMHFITTAAEPSKINNQIESYIYASTDGVEWSPIVKGSQDFLSAKSKKFFQYPVFSIPKIKNSDYLFTYGRGMAGYDDVMLRYNINALKKVNIGS